MHITIFSFPSSKTADKHYPSLIKYYSVFPAREMVFHKANHCQSQDQNVGIPCNFSFTYITWATCFLYFLCCASQVVAYVECLAQLTPLLSRACSKLYTNKLVSGSFFLASSFPHAPHLGVFNPFLLSHFPKKPMLMNSAGKAAM